MKQESTPEIVRHDVHLYAVVRLKIGNVPGNTDAERIDNATAAIDLNRRFNSPKVETLPEQQVLNLPDDTPVYSTKVEGEMYLDHAEFTDEFAGFLVDTIVKDKDGEPDLDEVINEPRWFCSDGETPAKELTLTERQQLRNFLRPLEVAGFGDDDSEVNAGDVVDYINEHLETLQSIANADVADEFEYRLLTIEGDVDPSLTSLGYASADDVVQLGRAHRQKDQEGNDSLFLVKSVRGSSVYVDSFAGCDLEQPPTDTPMPMPAPVETRTSNSRRFLEELENGFESFNGIIEVYGDQTFCDLMYLTSAILSGGFIEVFSEESYILDVVKQLPSGVLWRQYIRTEDD